MLLNTSDPLPNVEPKLSVSVHARGLRVAWADKFLLSRESRPSRSVRGSCSVALASPCGASLAGYQLFETYDDEVKAVWEERFEKKFGFWRGFVDTAVARYLDCGVAEGG